MTPPVHVLLFDEEPILRRATALMLGARGAEVTSAASVDELVAHAEKRIYDVAILDVQDEASDAAEIVARMRKGGLVPRRVVVCAPRPLDRREADAFTQVLLKPYAFQQLVDAVFGPKNRRRPTRSGVFSSARGGVPRVPRALTGGPSADVAWLARGQVASNENAARGLLRARRGIRPVARRERIATVTRLPVPEPGEPPPEAAGAETGLPHAASGRVTRPPRRAVRVRRGRG